MATLGKVPINKNVSVAEIPVRISLPTVIHVMRVPAI